MVYRVIGTMSGSSLDGLDIAFVELQETSGKWSYELKHAACYPYSKEWKQNLSQAKHLDATNYLLLHTAYGHYLGQEINRFISEYSLQYQVQLIASHGHTTIHIPEKKTTAQLGCGAAIATETGINVVSDLRALDVALGGQGAPIVPVGEKLLLGDYSYFLNLGGIANISLNLPDQYIAFDVCPANRILNEIASRKEKDFDDGGRLAESGTIDEQLLNILNGLEYYGLVYPKSLSNDFGIHVVLPLIEGQKNTAEDDLRTYVEHICIQVSRAAAELKKLKTSHIHERDTMLITGGGARNSFLIQRLEEHLRKINIEVKVPSEDLIDYKEAIIMALIGVLRWREESNTYASVTGASRNSIGGAVWIGQEA